MEMEGFELGILKKITTYKNFINFQALAKNVKIIDQM